MIVRRASSAAPQRQIKSGRSARRTRQIVRTRRQAIWTMTDCPTEAPIASCRASRCPIANGCGGASRFNGGHMLYYALVFFIVALVAALFGFGGIAAGAASIAKILFMLFLVMAVVVFLLGLFRRGRV